MISGPGDAESQTILTIAERVVGRFAPTPSGALHFGSLVTAIASYLDATQAGGDWLVRIDDLDAARTRAGAVDSILKALEDFGLEWSRSVVFQSQRGEFYEEALMRLIGTSRCYRCQCTRKEAGESLQFGPDGPIYNGICRTANHTAAWRHAWRLNTDGAQVGFTDRVQGEITRDLGSYVGDFIVSRSDLVAGYHLASVVDDVSMGVTAVVRGGDLIPSTLRQLFVAQLLGYTAPTFAHVPTIVDGGGRKLSKSSNDLSVVAMPSGAAFHDALIVLGQDPPADMRSESARTVRDWGIRHWDISKVPTMPVKAMPAYLRT